MTVGIALGVSHSTVSRWETGAVPLTSKDLEKLAKLYGISSRQLEYHPSAEEMIAFLDRAQQVIERMSREDLERWIAIGESLSRKEPSGD
jgi:transcriptional regulator with XRE-family HTH domain